MDRHHEHAKRVTGRVAAVGGALTVAAAALVVFAPAAGADTVSVGYGRCTSNQPAVAAPPPDYTTQVTLTPQGSSFEVGKAITIKWHYSVSTAPGPVGIPVPNVASAKAKIVISGAASSTISTESSANFPPVAVTPGQTFQIPDMTATFTPTTAGTYKLTPGDNEQDVKQFGVIVGCKASASGPAATITVGPATGGGTSSTTSAASPSSTSAAGASTSSSSATGDLPHTGFDGRWLAGGAVLAAVLGGGSLYATRRRRGSHS